MEILISLTDAALSIVNTAQEEGVLCRLMGSLAVRWYVGADKFPGRQAPAKDIDLIAKSADRQAIQQLMRRMGWRLDESLLLLAEMRETYHLKASNQTLDLYYDQIDGNHAIRLRDRLDADFPAISRIDLLLTKLQRRRLRPEDAWDICALLEEEGYQDDIDYFKDLVGRDWPVYTTVVDNLHACHNDGCDSRFLLDAAASSRKTLRWRFRALIGRRLKWWREVYSTASVGD